MEWITAITFVIATLLISSQSVASIIFLFLSPSNQNVRAYTRIGFLINLHHPTLEGRLFGINSIRKFNKNGPLCDISKSTLSEYFKKYGLLCDISNTASYTKTYHHVFQRRYDKNYFQDMSNRHDQLQPPYLNTSLEASKSRWCYR